MTRAIFPSLTRGREGHFAVPGAGFFLAWRPRSGRLQADRCGLIGRAHVRQDHEQLLQNIGWAKKGILSFSYTPLSMLSFFGTLLFFLSILLGAGQIASRLLMPSASPRGATTIILCILSSDP